MQTPATFRTMIIGVTTPQSINLPDGLKRLSIQSIDVGGAGGSISVFDSTGSPLAMQIIGAGGQNTCPHWDVWTSSQNITVERTGAHVRALMSIYTY